MNKLKIVLSGKWITFLVFFLSIAGRIIQVVFFYNIRVDRSFQLMAMQNFVDGHGVALSYVLPSDLSSIVYEPLIKWPPGYSLIIAPFYLLFNKNYILSTLAIDIVFAILLIIACRKILDILSTPKYLINLFTLFGGFFLYDFYVITSSDAITVTFFLLAIYFTLRLVKKSEKSVFLNSIMVRLCLFLCALLKYLFIPVVFVIPVFLFAYGFFNKKGIYKKSAVSIFILLAFCIGALLIYQKSIGDSSVYISQPERGFFLRNLLRFYPFIPASFLKPATIESVTYSGSGIYYEISQVITLLLSLFILYVFIRSLYKSKLRGIPIQKVFFYIAFAVSFVVVSVLIFLSLTVSKEEPFPGVFWSYVEEPRYYGIVLVLIQLSFIANHEEWFTKKRLVFISFPVLIFSVELVHGIYFDLRRIKLSNKEEYGWQYEDRFQKYADSLLKNELKKYPAIKTVVTGSSYYMNHRVSLYSHATLLSGAQSINELPSMRTKEPVLLFIILNEKDLHLCKPFTAVHNEVAGKFNDFYFYTVYVKPH